MPRPISISNVQSSQYPIAKGCWGGLLAPFLDIEHWPDWTFHLHPPPPPAASFRLRLFDRHALCSRCGSVERAGRPRPRRSTRRGSSSEKWCRRGEIGKRGDLASLWAKALPGGAAAALAASLCFATTPGAGTHRTTPALRTSTHDVDCRYLPSLSSVFATPTEPEGACRPAPVSISNRQSHKYPIPKGLAGEVLNSRCRALGYWIFPGLDIGHSLCPSPSC